MVADRAMIDPGLTYDEAMALYGWTVGLAAMTGVAFAIGAYPGARTLSFPPPAASLTPATSRQVMTAGSGVPRFRSRGRPADIEGIGRLATKGQHTSCRRHRGRIESSSQLGRGECQRVSPPVDSRDGSPPPRDHPQACDHEVPCGHASSNGPFWRALEFFRHVLKASHTTGLFEEVDE